jgi:predicted phage terminase large subunit-like protein
MSLPPRELQSEQLAQAYEDFACFAIALWPRLELASHHLRIVSQLEAIESGTQSRLIICMPPRHGKSLLTSILFVAWYLGRHPDHDVIFVTYSQELSDYFGRQVRNLFADPIYQNIFRAARLSEDSAAIHRFATTRGGSYLAVGRGGSITGRGASLLVIDDPLKDHEEAQSETVRRDVYDFFTSVACTRLAPGGRIVIIQTRWHENDLAGRLLREHGERWKLLSLSAIAEVDDGYRKEGEPLWPEWFSLDELERKRAEIGPKAWTSLYQQRPSAAEGVVFKRDWVRTYREPPQSFQRIIQSWDTATKAGAENDYSVCTTWGVTDTGYYLLSFWRGRVEFPELMRQVSNQAEQWRPHAILIEDNASGPSLIQVLKSATRLPVLAIRVDKYKRARAEAVTPLFDGGKIFVPESAPWVQGYVDELAAFPDGSHDDAVDSTTQALNYLRQVQSLALAETFLRLNSPTEQDLDKEELWEKAMMGMPLTEEELDKL